MSSYTDDLIVVNCFTFCYFLILFYVTLLHDFLLFFLKMKLMLEKEVSGMNKSHDGA